LRTYWVLDSGSPCQYHPLLRNLLYGESPQLLALLLLPLPLSSRLWSIGRHCPHVLSQLCLSYTPRLNLLAFWIPRTASFFTHTTSSTSLYRKLFLSVAYTQLLFSSSQLVLVLIVLHPPHWPSLIVDGPARQSFPVSYFLTCSSPHLCITASRNLRPIDLRCYLTLPCTM